MIKADIDDPKYYDPEHPFCIGCEKFAEELSEYNKENTECELTPAQYVKQEEGTYNRENGHFLCTPCYCKAGMPSGPRGWTAP